MTIKIDIQKAIIQAVKAGTFPEVKYDGDTTEPYLTGENATPVVWVNETQGSITDDLSKSSRSKEFEIDKWTFESVIKFPVEVDLTEFLRNEISELRFNSNGVLVTVKAGAFIVEHPVTQGAQTGTQLNLTLNANTRR